MIGTIKIEKLLATLPETILCSSVANSFWIGNTLTLRYFLLFFFPFFFYWMNVTKKCVKKEKKEKK